MLEPARILVVEDEGIVALDLSTRLESNGYQVTAVVSTGEAAISAAREQKPDIVLMDIHLRGKMSGIDAARAITAELDCAIVYLTAHSGDDTLIQARATRPHGYLLKPVEERNLVVTLDMVLAKHQLERELRASEQRHRQLLQSIQLPVVAVQRDWRIYYCNPAYAAFSGQARDDLEGRDLLQLVPDFRDTQTFLAYQAVLCGESGAQVVDDSFDQRSIRSWVYPADWGLLAVTEDITNQKALERALKDANLALEHNVAERTADLTAAIDELNQELEMRLRAEDALLREKQYVESIIQTAQVIILVLDTAGCIVEFNPYLQQLTAYTLDEVQGKNWFDIFVPREDVDRRRKRFSLALQGRRTRGEIDSILTKTGARRMIAWYDQQLKNPASENGVILAVGVDVTERQQAIKALEAANQQLELSQIELSRRVDELETLRRISMAVSSHLETSDLLQYIVEQGARLVNARHCVLYLPDAAHTGLVCEAAVDPAILGRRVPLDQGFAARVYRDGIPLVTNTPAGQEKTSEGMSRKRTANASLLVPMQAEGTVVGVLQADAKLENEFSRHDLDLLQTLAAQAAIALQNARLYDQLQAYAATLQQRVAERTLELQRANSLVSTLSRVALGLKGSADPSGMLQSMALELRKVGISFVVLLKVPETGELEIYFTAYDPANVKRVEQVLRRKLLGTRLNLERYPIFRQIFRHRQAQYFPELEEYLAVILADETAALRKAVLHISGLPPSTHAALFPLISGERTLGILGLLGQDLLESDLPAFTVFAGQVANTLETAQLNTALQHLAVTDELTGCFNRRGFQRLGRREIDRVRRFGHSLSMVMFDLDHFKRVNDAYGHPLGDEVLVAITARCQQQIREVDLLVRYGGEEFIVLMPETQIAEAVQAAERLRACVADEPLKTSAGDIAITISLGVAVVDQKSPDLDALLAGADAALYAAKRGGRNRVEIFQGGDDGE